jgi:hypothetical protein
MHFTLAIWNARNYYVFNNEKSNSFMKVISMATHWTIRGPSYNQWRGDKIWIQPYRVQPP